MSLLTREEMDSKSQQLSGWKVSEDGKFLNLNSVTQNFAHAVDLINKICDFAEQMDHHPDIHLTDYKKLEIVLTTHSEKGLTQKDFDLALMINRVL